MTVKSTFSFTKLVVGDLEKSAAFYTEVCGLVEQARVEADVNGDPISEILFDPPYPGGPTFVLFKFLKRPAPTPGETILGFITPDVDAFVARAKKAGCKVVQDVKSDPEHGVKVGFVTDVEGRLIEVVELLQK